MQYGYIVPNFNYCGDARTLVDLACMAEDAGWDGFFTWDHIQFPNQEPTADPWIAFGAIAMRTDRIRLGPMVTPLPRRHIAKLAREATTLDHLSGGRVILGVGAGAPELPEYTAFGDSGDKKVRGAMLDEGLAVLDALWSGEAVEHRGEHYTTLTPGFGRPAQQPRIPIWVAGTWPYKKPFRRAARWDGVFPMHQDSMKGYVFPAEEVAAIVTYITEHRTSDGPYDVCMGGMTFDAGDNALVGAYAQAGATWWLEASVPWIATLDDVRARLRTGPPRI